MEPVAAVALSAACITYNNVVNPWPPFHGGCYVPLNLGFAIVVTVLTAASLGLSPVDLGLSADVGDLLIPVAGIAAFAFAVLAIAVSRYGHLIADRRVRELKGAALAYHALLRIPIGTALTKELLFRGTMYAAWRAAGASTVTAALCAAVSFGLWHVSPTAILVSINAPMASARKLRMTIAGAVIFTTIAALGLTWLRLETGGLVAPILLHAGVNSVGALGAVVAGRRVEAQAAATAQPVFRMTGMASIEELERLPTKGLHERAFSLA